MLHATHDAVSLALARPVAYGLLDHPEWIELAKSNLDRWSKRNSESHSLLACYKEWQEILKLPADQISRILLAETHEGQRLRQNSPFAGVLPPKEVWRIKRETHATFRT